MDPAVINKAIDQAIAECQAQGVHGKATTPFLLARVKDITGGDSLDSNIHLVFNNARLAARTAAEAGEAGADMKGLYLPEAAGDTVWGAVGPFWPWPGGLSGPYQPGRLFPHVVRQAPGPAGGGPAIPEKTPVSGRSAGRQPGGHSGDAALPPQDKALVLRLGHAGHPPAPAGAGCVGVARVLFRVNTGKQKKSVCRETVFRGAICMRKGRPGYPGRPFFMECYQFLILSLKIYIDRRSIS